MLIRISWSKLKAQAAGSTGAETTSPGLPLASGIPSSPAQGQESSATDAQQRSWDLSPDGSLPQELSRETGHVSMQEPAKRQKLRKITTKAKCNPHRCHLSQSCQSGPRGRRGLLHLKSLREPGTVLCPEHRYPDCTSLTFSDIARRPRGFGGRARAAAPLWGAVGGPLHPWVLG